MSSVTAAQASPLRRDAAAWNERSARLFEELRAPATAMVRRAFGSAFDDHVIEDIYASAWLGTLRALERRHADLDDEEVRKYLLTAVARQASKELRRRRRRPVAPLENLEAVGDDRMLPDEQADQREQSTITRDLLSSLPRRRRAVLMLRYGWGLEPSKVCELIDGLSPRAYRKEITRGVDQLAERVRTLQNGEWCAEREPILKAFAAGLADADEQRQAEHHLAHCRHCADFVGKLSGHLHDLGSSLAVPGVLDLAADGRISIPDRLAELADRTRESLGSVFSRGGSAASEAGPASVPAAAPRGAGAAGAGVLAKLAGLSAGGKVAIACIGGGAAAVVCAAAGVGPLHFSDEPRHTAGIERSSPGPARPGRALNQIISSRVASAEPPGPAPGEGDPPPSEHEPDQETPPSVETAPAPAPAPVEQFGLAPASTSGSTPTSGSGAGGRAQSGAGDFGP